jgi:hypothetical protein
MLDSRIAVAAGNSQDKIVIIYKPPPALFCRKQKKNKANEKHP